MKKLVYLIDLAHESKLGLSSDTMPLQLGLIGAYCLKEHGSKVDVRIFKFVGGFLKAMKKKKPFIIGVSNYLWNINIGYKFISEIKKKYPDIITVFGGPNYPEELKDQIEWLKKHPYVDFYIYKDGEISFSRLVGELLKNPDANSVKKLKLPSCHSLIKSKPYFGELEPRIKDLSIIPSPYTTGLMDDFFKYRLIPMIQTARGCPFTCAYCCEGENYYAFVAKRSLEDKKAEIDYIVNNIKHTKNLRITDSNFAMYPEDVEFCRYLSKVQKKTGYPEYLGCSTGKNRHERVLECNKLLRGAIRLTASVQSLVPEVLKNVRRQNISLEDIMKLSDQVSDSVTNSYSEIILALPGDSLAGEEKSISGLMDAGISNITQHQFALINGAHLNLPENRKKFGMKSMFRPVQRSIGIYSFDGEKFNVVEAEEICVANKTMSFKDYLEARRLYLSVGMFYNDRVFGEIHALLRLLKLSTWEWVSLVHKNINKYDSEIKKLYSDFIKDTKNELWKNEKEMFQDVGANIDKYTSGEIGGNLIYKYRALGFVKYFSNVHKIAFNSLREYLKKKNIKCNEIVEDLEKFSLLQKNDIFNSKIKTKEAFGYDILRMIEDPSLARNNGSLEDIHYPIRVSIGHTKEQKESLQRQLDFYGSDLGGLTMLISRFPIKRFYRKVEVIK